MSAPLWLPRAPYVVQTAGVWDTLHAGHLAFLYRARQLGDLLVIGVVTDEGTAAYKGRKPVQPEGIRLAKVKALGLAHVVELQDTTDPTPLLERYRPNVFVHADGQGSWSLLRERVEAAGVQYLNLPYTDGISSSQLRERIG